MSDENEHIDEEGIEEEVEEGTRAEEESSEESGFPKWMGQLPDKLKNSEELKQFDSIAELAENRAELLAKNEELQAELVVKNEELQAEIDKVPIDQQIPADPSGYELELPDDLKLEIQQLPPKLAGFKDFYEGWADTLKGWCHEIGLNKTQATQLFNSEVGLFKKMMDSGEEHIQRELAYSEEQQKKAWGPHYQENCEKSRRARDAFAPAGSELSKVIDLYELGNKPAFIEHFYNLYKNIGEDSMGPGGPKIKPDPATEKEQSLRERYPNSPELWNGE